MDISEEKFPKAFRITIHNEEELREFNEFRAKYINEQQPRPVEGLSNVELENLKRREAKEDRIKDMLSIFEENKDRKYNKQEIMKLLGISDWQFREYVKTLMLQGRVMRTLKGTSTDYQYNDEERMLRGKEKKKEEPEEEKKSAQPYQVHEKDILNLLRENAPIQWSLQSICEATKTNYSVASTILKNLFESKEVNRDRRHGKLFYWIKKETKEIPYPEAGLEIEEIEPKKPAFDKGCEECGASEDKLFHVKDLEGLEKRVCQECAIKITEKKRGKGNYKPLCGPLPEDLLEFMKKYPQDQLTLKEWREATRLPYTTLKRSLNDLHVRGKIEREGEIRSFKTRYWVK